MTGMGVGVDSVFLGNLASLKNVGLWIILIE